MEEYRIGIDFGACNIKVVALKGKGLREVKLNKHDTGGNETSNIIHYKKMKNGVLDVIIGSKARNYAVSDTENSVVGVKRRLACETWSQFIPALNKNVDAVRVSTDIFTCVRNSLPLSQGQSVRAMITVPVSFSMIQCQRLRKAAEDAGITVEGVISEPFASLFSLEDLLTGDPQLAVIFDFGGSTLDVSIASVEKKGNGPICLTELAAGGIPLGGLDIDEAICTEIIDPQYSAELPEAYGNDTPEVMRQRLLLDVEILKRQVFEDEEEEVEHLAGGLTLSLKRSAVEELLERDTFKGKIIALLDSLFEELMEGPDGFTKDNVSIVLPFGGTSRIPAVQRILRDYFGSEIFNDENFDFTDTSMFVDGIEDRCMAVAGGAARYMEMVLKHSEDVRITTVIPFRIGFARAGKFRTCINRNEPYGYETLYMRLPAAELASDGWRLAIYQSFTSGQSYSDLSSAIYLGSIDLDRSLYNEKETVLMKMRMARDGSVRLRLFQQLQLGEDAELEIVQIEEHFLKIGK
ncbi:MAG: Hsp70 family protein [Desulfovibrionaceae bacterium]|nr:Hsp70 family protein [Desulfovibrionaceae bacterium]